MHIHRRAHRTALVAAAAAVAVAAAVLTAAPAVATTWYPGNHSYYGAGNCGPSRIVVVRARFTSPVDNQIQITRTPTGGYQTHDYGGGMAHWVTGWHSGGYYRAIAFGDARDIGYDCET